MSGALVTTGRAATKDLIGADAYERALASVRPEIAAEYRAVTVLSWIPLAVVEPVIEAMGNAAGRDPLALQDEVTRVTLQRSFQTIWRVFLKMTSNEGLLTRLPLVFSKAYNRGRLTTSFPTAERAVVELVEWPNTPLHVLRSTGVGVEVMLQAAGRGEARVSFDRTTRGAVFTATGLARP